MKREVKNNQNFTKGITLIALVVTIVVLLILAGISINLIFGQDGIINAAKQAVIKKAQAEKEEEVRLAITALLLRNEYDESKVTVSAVVEEVKKNYPKQEAKDSISGMGTGDEEDKFPGIIQYDKPSSTIDGTIIVQVDENLNVTSKLDEPEPPIELPQSEYKKIGDTYYNTPELMKFNPENTYYITYDANGNNETVYGRLDKVEAPSNWYDYEKKIWANLVTVNGYDVTYWTWIPRYMYKIGEEEKTSQTVDIKFVDVNDQYQGKDAGTVNLEDYQLPESFIFGEGENKNISGYWMSKYEVQNTAKAETIRLETVNSSIYVTTNTPNGTYTIFLDGKKYKTGVELPYYIEDLTESRDYQICLVNETSRKMLGFETIRVRIEVNDSSKNIEVDTSKFNKANTYYVTYDENGENETIYGRMDKVEQPANWYNYDKKIWANLVTVNGNEVAYWTYIPRYEYITYPLLQYTDVRYIPSSKTEADTGYKIPESFTFGDGKDKNLKGYWISKYEIQNASLEQIKTEPKDSSIYVTTNNPKGTYTIFVDGVKNAEGVELPHYCEVELDREYEICLYSETNKRFVGSTKAIAKTNDTLDTVKNIQIDLTGFNPSCTYYVTYDENGENEKRGELIKVDANGTPTNAPTDWYDYAKKKWANIVTENEGQITYWTYIPRYEYITYPLQKYLNIRFIPSSQTTASEGYKIPESFTFGDGKDKNLKGYWITKYEIQNK